MGGGGTMGTLLREKDWTKTELGAIESWDQTLVTMTALVINSTHPMALWWGKDQILIYNDGYIPVAGDRHPAAFGSRASDHWIELGPMLSPLIDDVMKGESVYTEDARLIMHRHGYPEVHPCPIELILGNVLYLVLHSNSK
jgi:hypothetical protein